MRAFASRGSLGWPTIFESAFCDEFVSSAPVPYAVSKAEADSYYAGLPSEPTLLYRTGAEKWTPPTGPEAQPRQKEPVFGHAINNVWNDALGWIVVDVIPTTSVIMINVISRCSLYDDRSRSLQVGG